MGNITKKLKRVGQVVVTTAMLGLFTATSLGATGQALAENIDTGDILNNMVAITQDVKEVASSGGDILVGMFSIPSASASYDEGGSFYQKMDKKIDNLLNKSFFPKIEKKTKDNKARIKILKSVNKKVASFKKKSKYKTNEKFKFIIDVLISKIDIKIKSYEDIETAKTTENISHSNHGNSNINENTNNSGNVNVDNTNKTSSYQNFLKNPLSQEYVKAGGVFIDMDKVITDSAYAKKVFTYENYLIMKKVLPQGTLFDGTNLDESKLPYVIATGKTIEEIQKITQRYNATNENAKEIFPNSIGSHYLIENSNGIQQPISSASTKIEKDRAGKSYYELDDIKYGVIINGEIKRGTQKYIDFQKDYFSDYEAKVIKGTIEEREWAVKLEPLSYLGDNKIAKIRAGEKLSPEELLTIWKTVLKKENLDKYFEITESKSNYAITLKKGIISPSEKKFTMPFKWNKYKSKALTSNPIGASSTFITETRNLTDFLFSR